MYPGDASTEASPEQTEVSYSDALRAEVAAEQPAEQVRDIPDGAIPVPLAGTTVVITRPGGWTTATNDALRFGDWNTWAERALVAEDVPVWYGLNGGEGPTNDQVLEMLDVWQRLTVNSLGKLPTSIQRLMGMARS